LLVVHALLIFLFPLRHLLLRPIDHCFPQFLLPPPFFSPVILLTDHMLNNLSFPLASSLAARERSERAIILAARATVASRSERLLRASLDGRTRGRPCFLISLAGRPARGRASPDWGRSKETCGVLAVI